jgi:putative transcriptional regulator
MKNRVKELRKNQKLTQEELADLIGISRQAINAIEKEKFDPSLPTAFKMANLFKTTLKTYLHFLINMKESKTSTGAGIGLIAGVIIGSITNNVGLWIALGLCFGAGIGQILDK